MKTTLLSLILASSLSLTVAGSSASPEETPSSLSEAISEFNARALLDPIGKTQEPLTEAEVTAAIRLWDRPADSPVSDELLHTFKDIATTGKLPLKGEFESLNGYDRGGAHVFDVWSVRIRLEREDGSSYAFLIRERVVGSRTLEEELARLEDHIKETGVERMVGGYRITERRDALRARITGSPKQ